MAALSHRITTSSEVLPKLRCVRDMSTKNKHFSPDFAISLPEDVGLLNLEEEGTRIPRNVGNCLQVDTA
jgi:hypothetical protein